MQGRKTFEGKQQMLISLLAHVPAQIFYYRLHQRLNLDFPFQQTQQYYGSCWQQVIDLALVKANTSVDDLGLKMHQQELNACLRLVRTMSIAVHKTQ